ncbi:MAG: RNase adapter RapZ [Nitrospiraceae bacterium]|nr:RNase adapter RapZ [Nitrospiraceae bacterium]
MARRTPPSPDRAGSKAAAGPSRVVIITGLSGSGKTVGLRAVEDLDFFCVDNLPVSLIGSLVAKTARAARGRNIAIGIDIREQEFLSGIHRVLGSLRKKHRVEVLFLDAETDVLIRRFKETRRPHPLGGDLSEAIRKERQSLAGLRREADRVIDTSSLSPHQLRRLITALYLPGGGMRGMGVTLTSFGFKYGAPQNIDLLFDVRFLPNPHFIAGLKLLDGTDKKVADFVFRHADTREFMKKTLDLIRFLLPRYAKEGRSYLAIAVGCTGGRHRSPAIVEKIGAALKKEPIDLRIIHRDIS